MDTYPRGKWSPPDTPEQKPLVGLDLDVPVIGSDSSEKFGTKYSTYSGTANIYVQAPNPVLPGELYNHPRPPLNTYVGDMGFVAHVNQSRENESIATFFGSSGGPGSASRLQMDVQNLGPNGILHDPYGHVEPRIVENEASPIAEANIVCVDPIGTGHSRMAPGQNETRFYDVQSDAELHAEFIKTYRETFHQTDSPLIIVGSSYAAFRATGGALELEKQGVHVDGLVFISGHYDYSLQDYDQEDPRPYAYRLPAMALSAHHFFKDRHKSTAAMALYEEVVMYAKSEYIDILENLEAMSAEERRTAAEKLSRYIGLSAEEIDAAGFRIDPFDFQDALLEDRGMVLSALDGRLAFPDSEFEIDPAIDRWEKVYKEAVKDHPRFPYIKDDYKFIAPVAEHWRFTGAWQDGRVDTAMEELLTRNPDLHILHCAGIYDFTNPPLCAEDFWDRMSEKTGVTVRRIAALAISDYQVTPGNIPTSAYAGYRTEPGVDIALFRAGHATGADPFARRELGTALRSMARTLREKRNEQRSSKQHERESNQSRDGLA